MNSLVFFLKKVTNDTLVPLVTFLREVTNGTKSLSVRPHYWPNEWFQHEDMLQVDLTPEEIAGYLMAKSGRLLSNAPQIDLRYPLPPGAAS